MADKQTYTFSNDITTVEVSSLGAKIVVIPQDRADIYVEYDNPKDSPEFCAVLSGKTLTLKESFSFSIFGSKPAEGYTITVYLPLRTFEKLKINTASGGVEVGEVSAEQFSLNTASGNIDISAYFNDVKLQSASGSIKLTNPLADKEKQEQTVSLDKDETAPAKYVSKSVSVCTVSGNAVVSGRRVRNTLRIRHDHSRRHLRQGQHFSYQRHSKRKLRGMERRPQRKPHQRQRQRFAPGGFRR